MTHNQVAILPITPLVDTIAAINKIWDQIYAKHEKEISALIEDGYDLYVTFYTYMLVMKDLSDSNAKALEKIIEELDIAETGGGIDAEGANEIDFFSKQILDSMTSEHNKNVRIHQDVVDNCERITKKKDELGKNMVVTQLKSLGGSVAGGTAVGAIAGTVVRGAVIGTGGALAIGFVVGAGVLGAIGQVFCVVAKSKFKGLGCLLDELHSKLKELQVKSEEFSTQTSSLVRNIREQVKCSECLVRVHDSTRKQRVVNAITSLSNQSVVLKNGFFRLSAVTQKNIDDLRIIVARHAPKAVLAYEG
ncbi:hypothetical protein EC991_007046 [Linnemannia zychae]|nr:hypothetical protein EC991_007046 [Linnemannia zychae]